MDIFLTLDKSKWKVILLTLNNSRSNKDIMSFSTLFTYGIIPQTPKIITKFFFSLNTKVSEFCKINSNKGLIMHD